MKKDRLHGFGLAVLLLSMLLLTACGASAADTGGAGSDDLQQTEGAASQQEDATLEDLLGEDYAAIADESILSQIPEKEAEEGLDYWEEDFTGVTEDTKFYINEAGNPVIVFGEYEIAPGAAGEPEFEIAR